LYMYINSVFYIKDTTDTDKSALYLDLHLEIDSEGRLRTNLYDKRDDFSQHFVGTVNFNNTYI
jgi:DNA-dependent RNA polymerase auxiliary subunit epsilon